MSQVLLILLGVLLACGASVALGLLAVNALRLPLVRQERLPIAFLAGSGLLSAVVFLLCAAHVYYRGVILAVTLAAIAAAIWRLRGKTLETPPFPDLSKTHRAMIALGALPFGILYLANAFAPEMSPDGSTYHLGVIAHYARAHGFVPLHTTIYASLSQGVELVYLVAFTFGRHSAAAVTHFVYLLAVCWLMISFGRRFGHPEAGIAGAFLFWASPIVGVDGVSAYIDVATAAIIFGAYYLLQVWCRDHARSNTLLLAAGFLCGFAFAAKYTAGVILLYALVQILFVARSLRPAHITVASALTLILPWLIRNAIYTGNPLAPFFNRWFPNPYVHVQWEEDYKRYFHTYDMPNLWHIPWDAAVRGDYLGGVAGPLFLLVPLALVLGVWRRPTGALLFAAAFCLIPYPLNIGTRFLIPALPFFALAIAETFASLISSRRAATFTLAGLMVVNGVLCWPKPPGLLPSYVGGTWRLLRIPWKQALRLEPEDAYLSRMQPGYARARLLDRLVPKGEIVFAQGPIMDAYTSHEVAVYFLSAFGENSGDVLFTGFKEDRQPVRLMRFNFPAANLRKIRIEQTATVDTGEQWAASEVRLFHQGRELERAPNWRLTAKPNPYDIPFAFDNSPVTRWRSQQAPRPGDFIEIDLGESRTIDRVDFETSADHWQTRMRLLGAANANGPFTELRPEPEELDGKPTPHARRLATLELAARGIRYLLVDPNDYAAKDIYRAPGYWGLEPIGEAGGARLYRVEPLP